MTAKKTQKQGPDFSRAGFKKIMIPTWKEKKIK